MLKRVKMKRASKIQLVIAFLAIATAMSTNPPLIRIRIATLLFSKQLVQKPETRVFGNPTNRTRNG